MKKFHEVDAMMLALMDRIENCSSNHLRLDYYSPINCPRLYVYIDPKYDFYDDISDFILNEDSDISPIDDRDNLIGHSAYRISTLDFLTYCDYVKPEFISSAMKILKDILFTENMLKTWVKNIYEITTKTDNNE